MLYEAQQYTEFRDSVEGGLDALVKKFTDTSGDSEGASGDTGGSTGTDGTGDSPVNEGADGQDSP